MHQAKSAHGRTFHHGEVLGPQLAQGAAGKTDALHRRRQVLGTHGVHTCVAASEMRVGTCAVFLQLQQTLRMMRLRKGTISLFREVLGHLYLPILPSSVAGLVLFAVASRMASTTAMDWVDHHVAGT